MPDPDLLYGTWWTPGEREEATPGVLSIPPRGTPLLELDGPANFAGWNEPVPVINGELVGGGYVSMLRAHPAGIQIGLGTITKYRGWVLRQVWVDSEDQTWARRIEATMPSLVHLLGQPGVATPLRQSARARTRKISFASSNLSWKASSGTEIELGYSSPQTSISKTRVAVSVSPTCVLTSPTARSTVWWVEQWLIPINDLVTVLCGRQSNPTSVSGWPVKRPKGRDRFQREVSLHMRGIGSGDEQDESNRAEVLCTLSAIDGALGGLPGVVTRYEEVKTNHGVFVGLVLDAINNAERPRANRYLDLVAALESYHSSAFGRGPMAHPEYNQQRKEAIQAVKQSDLPDQHKRFIKRNLAPRSSYSLEKRLRDLRRSAAVTDSSVSESDMAKLRNDLAHGNGSPDGGLLDDALRDALSLARRTLLGSVGIPV